MGCCSSVHKTPFFTCCKTKELLPINEKKPIQIDGEYPVAQLDSNSKLSPLVPVKSFRNVEGSKEEAFFDSQAWLESDCEEDFVSVNGDFTPSRGNTPNYQIGFVTTPQQTKSLLMDREPLNSRDSPNSIPEPSPASKKKRLSELFEDSFGELELEATAGDLTPKSEHTTLYTSGVNGGPNREMKSEKEKSPSAVQCCLPRFTPRQ